MKKRKISPMAMVLTLSLVLNILCFAAYVEKKSRETSSSTIPISQEMYSALAQDYFELKDMLEEYGEEYPEIQEKMKELYPELYEEDPTSAAQE